MRRFRLLSFIVATLVASGLLWLNVRGRWISRDVPDLANLVDFGTLEYGFPRTAISKVGRQYPRDSFLPEFNNFPPETLISVNDGVMYPDNPTVWHPWPVIVDLLVLLATPTLALFACESFLRRRESRAHASRRSPNA